MDVYIFGIILFWLQSVDKSKEWGIDTYKYTKYNTKNDHAIHSFTKML